MFNYLKVSPPAEKSDRIVDIYINIKDHPVSDLQVYPLLLELSQKGESLNWEGVDQHLIANSLPPRNNEESEELSQKLCDKVANQWVEVLNYVIFATGDEVSERSYIELIEELPVPEDEIDCI